MKDNNKDLSKIKLELQTRKEVLDEYLYCLISHDSNIDLEIRLKYSNLNNNTSKDTKVYYKELGKAIFESIVEKYSYYEINAILNGTDDYEFLVGGYYSNREIIGYQAESYLNSLNFLPRDYTGFGSYAVNNAYNNLISIVKNRGNNISDFEQEKNDAWQKLLDFEDMMQEYFKKDKIMTMRMDYIREYQKKNNVDVGMGI